MKPTQEQEAVVSAFTSGDDVVVTAGAGTGKTSTLRLAAAAGGGRRGLYVAFNKAIAEEAKRSFPRGVEARTAHSLAYRWATRDTRGRVLLDRMNRPRMPMEAVAEALGLEPVVVSTTRGKEVLSPAQVARHVREMVQAFLQSADKELDPAVHWPLLPTASAEPAALLAAALVKPATAVWEDMLSPTGVMPVDHAAYLKLWSLSEPRLPYDYILFDEAQDASPVIASVVTGQSCQRVLVGDPAQAIYGFTGAVDAMSAFESSHRLELTQSWRFGPQIAEAANAYLAALGTKFRLSGHPGRVSRVVGSLARPSAVLCRGNAEVIAETLLGQRRGAAVHILGGVNEPRQFVEGAAQLMQTGRSSHRELAVFRSWSAAQSYTEDNPGTELRTMVRLVDNYGIPTLRQVLDACVDERMATLTVSTVHKAKGREWASVELARDLDLDPILQDLSSVNVDVADAARDEIRVGYVAATRAMQSLGAGVVAESLAGFGFPTVSSQESAGEDDPGDGGGWVEIGLRIPTPVWEAYAASWPDAETAIGVLSDVVVDNLTGGAANRTKGPSDRRSLHSGRQGGYDQRGGNDQFVASNPYDRNDQQDQRDFPYGLVADEELGQKAADQVRGMIDDAVAAVVAEHDPATEIAAWELLEEQLDQRELTVHRRPGQTGYSLTTTLTGHPVRLSGSNFGPGYSGPALARRVIGRTQD